MRPNLVVVTSVLLDDDLGIDSVPEPLHAQALVAELAVERLVGSVLPRFSRINVRGIDVGLSQPLQHGTGDELRAVVRAQVLGASMDADQFAQHLDDPAGTDASGHVDRQTLASELIDHGQALELLSIGAGINEKVISPHLTHGHCRQWPWARSRHTTPG